MIYRLQRFSKFLSKGCASVYQRSIWDASLRLYIENTYNYFGVGINMTLKFPAGTMRMRLRCPIMIQRVYEFVHLCYKYIGTDICMTATGDAKGSLNLKYDMISAG